MGSCEQCKWDRSWGAGRHGPAGKARRWMTGRSMSWRPSSSNTRREAWMRLTPGATSSSTIAAAEPCRSPRRFNVAQQSAGMALTRRQVSAAARPEQTVWNRRHAKTPQVIAAQHGKRSSLALCRRSRHSTALYKRTLDSMVTLKPQRAAYTKASLASRRRHRQNTRAHAALPGAWEFRQEA